MVSGVLSLQRMGVAAAGVAAHGCCARGGGGAVVVVRRCCGCHHRSARGVAGAVIALRGSCPHHMLLLSSLSIEGPGGPLRERRPCTSARRQYLAANVTIRLRCRIDSNSGSVFSCQSGWYR